MTNSYYILGIVKQLTVSNLWLLQIFEFLLHQKGQYDGTIPGLVFFIFPVNPPFSEHFVHGSYGSRMKIAAVADYSGQKLE